MKSNIYIFLVGLLFSLNISAQENYSTMIMEEWANGTWKNSMKLTNTFDSNGNIIKESTESWDDLLKAWGNAMVTTHTLNSNSTINYSITQSWNNVAGAWEDMQKTIYTYDGSKKLLTQKVQMFFGTEWMDFGLTTNTYNGSNQLEKSVVQSLDFMTMGMVNSTQSVNTYNADGTENQSTAQKWNIAMSSWENTSRTTNAYTSGKKMSSMVIENYTGGVWVNSMKTSMTYNGDGSIKESLSQKWNVSSGTWVDSDKAVYSLYPDGSINQMLLTEWKADLSKWENQSRITYTYKTTSVSQLETSKIKVFPNPFSNSISIEYNSLNVSDIQLYNSNGQLVRTIGKGESLSTINLSALKNGVYILKVNTPESQKVVKLLKYR
jgi:hypothetical protein